MTAFSMTSPRFPTIFWKFPKIPKIVPKARRTFPNIFLAKNDNTSAIADHVKATPHNIKWDHFDILAKGKTDYHCKIKETLYIQELEPAFNVNVGSEKLMLY